MQLLELDPECGTVGIWMGAQSLYRSGAEILGLTSESHRFTRPTACAFLLQASAGETKRSGLCVANYCSWPDTRARDAGGEGDGVWSRVCVHHETITSCPHRHTRLEYQHSFSVNMIHD